MHAQAHAQAYAHPCVHTSAGEPHATDSKAMCYPLPLPVRSPAPPKSACWCNNSRNPSSVTGPCLSGGQPTTASTAALLLIACLLCLARRKCGYKQARPATRGEQLQSKLYMQALPQHAEW